MWLGYIRCTVERSTKGRVEMASDAGEEYLMTKCRGSEGKLFPMVWTGDGSDRPAK